MATKKKYEGELTLDKIRSLGGKAAAANMTPEERRERARKAGLSRKVNKDKKRSREIAKKASLAALKARKLKVKAK